MAAHYAVTPIDLVSDRRTRTLTEPRHVIGYLARHMTTLSLPAIGRRLRRDHSTIYHSVVVVGRRIAVDPVLAARVSAFMAALRERS